MTKSLADSLSYTSYQKTKTNLSHLGTADFTSTTSNVVLLPYNETIINLNGNGGKTFIILPRPDKLPCGKAMWFINVSRIPGHKHSISFHAETGVTVNDVISVTVLTPLFEAASTNSITLRLTVVSDGAYVLTWLDNLSLIQKQSILRNVSLDSGVPANLDASHPVRKFHHADRLVDQEIVFKARGVIDENVFGTHFRLQSRGRRCWDPFDLHRSCYLPQGIQSRSLSHRWKHQL